ncbi:PREDICTED: protein ST7 homolog, partial [Papilio xuthus]|uniref:Protein ST7 homolog n=1 Tax=Papilio xuthus TaxID=66420 RepID=A0AAJ6ZDJ8_PAPXU
MWDSSTFLSALTPKFYVALTGTSSLISGLILIFEWWYFRKYGTSFIEQMSLAHLGPWLGGGGAGGYYDMNLTAQEHQAWFGRCGGAEQAAEAHMARAWRSRSPGARVAAARAALAERADCAAALLLLAEEDAPTVLEAERVLRRAWRAGEAAWRARGGAGAGVGAGAGGGARARRCAAVLAHVKRRAAMCARRLGRLRDAARMFRELARDAPPALAPLATHENLIEVLLEQRAYADVQALVSRYEECAASRSAVTVYTAALLRARTAACAAPPARTAADLAALEAMSRAVEFNPHVPAYLLEQRALALPPEHVVRRGDSEALAYAFWHLRHWRHVDGALRLLAHAAQATSSRPARCLACNACGDRELLGGRGGWG